MDMTTVVVAAFSSVVVSAITAYITTRLRIREESLKWQRDFAVQRAITRAKDPQAAEQMATPFAIGFLVIDRGDGARDRFFLAPGDRIIAGRDPSNPIVVSDPRYSRRHLAFEADADSAWVLDLGSRGGVFVNGLHVSGRRVLSDGDVIAATSQKDGGPFFRFHSISKTGAE